MSNKSFDSHCGYGSAGGWGLCYGCVNQVSSAPDCSRADNAIYRADRLTCLKFESTFV